MPNYPYTKIQSNLRKFLDGISRRGVPPTIDNDHLKQLSFGGPNNAGIITVLEFIGFVNKDGKPTDAYINFRVSAKAEETMTEALKSAYSDLFDIYPDAHSRPKQELYDFFTPTTSAGEAVVRLITTTFLTLCEFSNLKPARSKREKGKGKPTRDSRAKKTRIKKSEGSVEKEVVVPTKAPQVVVNIQLVLPESKDPSLYDELFKSLKKHLLE